VYSMPMQHGRFKPSILYFLHHCTQKMVGNRLPTAGVLAWWEW
jgi:hypothetical protein